MEQAQLKIVAGAVHSAHTLQRIAGGSETDVYRTADGEHVLKMKQMAATSLEAAYAEIEAMRGAAMSFAAYLGLDHSIATDFFLSADGEGRFFAVGVQHFLAGARPLSAVDYQGLTEWRRTQVEWQLLYLLRQALRCYHETGHMPDLYGTFSRSVVERRRMNSPLMWPRRIWLFLTQRLWSAHNLLLTNGPMPRVVLVDYDQVRWRGLWGQLYYAICYLLFWRDLLWLAGAHNATPDASRQPGHDTMTHF